jgi:DNA end-binding protein Ku
MTEEDFDSLDVNSIRSIDVVSFVPLTDIDPVYFNKSYYVAPEQTGLKAYKLLAGALEAEGQVGVAKVSLRDKEHLATIRLRDDVFVLETMYWPDEIRAPEFDELDKRVDLRDNEVAMARQLIQQLSADFRPEEFTDEYRSALQGLIERKIEGEEVTVSAEPAEEPTKVIDLMEALKASVDEAKKRKEASNGSKKKTRQKASAS